MNFSFKIANFGRINDLEINIKPLTVIAGINDSGKSFATKGLYSVLSALNNDHIGLLFGKNHTSILKALQKLAFILTSKKDLKFLKKLESNINFMDDVVAEAFDKNLVQQLEFSKDIYIQKVIDSFIDDFNKFNKHLQTTPTKYEKIKIYVDSIEKSLYQIKLGIKDTRESLSESIGDSLTENFKKNFQTQLINLKQFNSEIFPSFNLSNIGDVKIEESRFSFSLEPNGLVNIQNLNNIIYLDSPIFAKIKRALQKKSNPYSTRDEEFKYYPQYVDDLFNKIDTDLYDTGDMSTISNRINTAINGKVYIDSNNYINYEDKDKNIIPISLAAMGIANIGIIGMLIEKGIIKKGSFLIIDEPEVHLHPEWQMEMIKVLLELSQSGINVVIATHSLEIMKYIDSLIENDKLTDKDVSLNLLSNIKFSDFEKEELHMKSSIIMENLSKPYYKIAMNLHESDLETIHKNKNE